MLAQPHSRVTVFSSIQSGRVQTPVGVGQPGPSVWVIVTQVFEAVVVVAVVDQARTLVVQVTRTAAG